MTPAESDFVEHRMAEEREGLRSAESTSNCPTVAVTARKIAVA
jgi:hypothetical protein